MARKGETADDVLIIGAGPAGLAVSLALGGRARTLEAGAEVGGLCRSVQFGGGVFDLGGHSFHSPHDEVNALVEGLMAGSWTTHRRDARVLFQGALLDYPFQAHIDQIADPAIREACRRGIAERPNQSAPENFEDWILARFGAGVAEHFMLPYNRKLWSRDLRRMSCEWVGERVAGGEAPAGSAPGRRPLHRDSEVGYPAEGGFSAIFQAMARRAGPVAFDRRVTTIDPAARIALTEAGERFAWRRLVSTMPLPFLLRAIEDCPPDLIAAADRLEFVSLKVLMILMAGPVGDAPDRVYIAGPEIPIHKLAYNHTSSPSLRARPVHAMMGEIAFSPDKPAPDDATLTRQSLDGLLAADLIATRADVIETRVADIVHGYPVYTPERLDILARIRAWLAPLGIHTIGRFGAWDYVNSDACIWQGMRLARALEAESPP